MRIRTVHARRVQSPKADVLSPQGRSTIVDKSENPSSPVKSLFDYTPSSGLLTAREQITLTECEGIIERGWVTFVDVGRALMTIRDGKLYRAVHPTFEAYCRERWHYQKSHAYRLIAAAEVIKCLSPVGDIPRPTHESQIRALAGLPPEQVVSIWKEAIAKASGAEVTASLVRKAAVEVLGTMPRRQNKSSQKDEPDTLRLPKKHLVKVVKLIEEAKLAIREKKEPAVAIRILQRLKGLLTRLDAKGL